MAKNNFPCDKCALPFEWLALCEETGSQLCNRCLLDAMKSNDPMRSHYENKLRKSEQAKRNFGHLEVTA